jgi:hypothetical protein
MKYLRDDSTRIARDKKGLLLISKDGSGGIRVDPLGFYVWFLCDGTKSKKKIVNEIIMLTAFDRNKAMTFVDKLLRTFSKIGVVKIL